MLAALCGIYVLAFGPANATGAANVNMLAIFRLDEFGQFRALWRMTEPRESAAETLHAVLAYDHYYYGFPFFAVSAAVFWPLRALYTATGEPGLTTAGALALRQLSPLFTALALAILVVLWTRLRSTPQVLALFAFLAAIPAVVGNNLWWHPDALLLLCVVVTLAALSLDRLRLGRWFLVAALACGFATATKATGLWFFAAVALHLLRARRAHPLPRVARAAAVFVAAMSLAIAAASPHFFLPDEWEEIGAAVATWRGGLEVGWGTVGEKGPLAWVPLLRRGFGWILTWTLLLALAGATAWRARRAEHRALALAILAWVVPLSVYLALEVALQVERYLLPVLVPLASCAGSPLLWESLRRDAPGLRRGLAGAAAALLGAQLGVNLLESARRYDEVLHREETSPSLAFWRRVEAEVLSQLPPDARVRIFSNLTVYVPPERRFDLHVRWRSTEYADLEASQPDLVLLQRAKIEHHSDPASIEASTDPARARRAHGFHRDAKADALPGYRRLLETDFAVAFGRSDTELAAGFSK